jgi:hypothetical protein
MRIDTIYTHDYTTIVNANGGEEQLIVMASFGQSALCALVIVAMTVDGGKKTLLDEWVPSSQVEDYLRHAISIWDKPNAIGPDTAGNVDRIITAFKEASQL